MNLLDFFRSILRRLAAMLLPPSTLKALTLSPKASTAQIAVVERECPSASLDALKEEVMALFRAPCTVRRMLAMSAALRIQYKAKLQESEACMLPSFCHTLPSGHERGTYICLDVGGSTLRVALVDLQGRRAAPDPMRITAMALSKIDERIRRMPSAEFFDWMAARIHAMLHAERVVGSPDHPLPVGLAWSFPIEQTSHRSGKMQGMGKGFACHEDTIGQDLATIIQVACARRQVHVRVDAIVNDSAATLLSQAYLDPATSMALILGTGTNVAAYLPTACMGRSKFGVRDPRWFRTADRVITNTELSMFGKAILPETRWDERLNQAHQKPDFQPLEYMTTGRYLGELLRLVIFEAVEQGHLFGGSLPPALYDQYSLDTRLLADLEHDVSEHGQDAARTLQTAFGLASAPSAAEVAFLRAVAESISYRASAYIAVAVHALWALQKDEDVNPRSVMRSPKTSIACNGSVILKYPGFKSRCEDFLREMIREGSAAGGVFAAERVVLEPTNEAAVFGAAVAVALAKDP